MLHVRGGRKAVSSAVYPDMAQFWDDVSTAYQHSIQYLADRGCTYLQLDDTSFSYLCDPKVREVCRSNGDDPDKLPQTYANAINAALRRIWERPIRKSEAQGIHGTLFYQLERYKKWYREKREDAIEPSAINAAQRRLFGDR